VLGREALTQFDVSISPILGGDPTLKLTFNLTETTYKGKVYRILVPAKSLKEVYLTDQGGHGSLLGNRSSWTVVAACFALLTQKKDFIIYLPIGRNDPAPLRTYIPWFVWHRKGDPLSHLVLCHHTRQLNRGDFKDMTKRLKASKLVSYHVNPFDFGADYTAPKEFSYKSNKDVLDIHWSSGICFIAGSAKNFRHLARNAMYISRFSGTYTGLSHIHLWETRHRDTVGHNLDFVYFNAKDWEVSVREKGIGYNPELYKPLD